MAKSPYLQHRTAKEALEEYKHIELTEDETFEALLVAKQKKEQILRRQYIEQIAEQNRRALTETQWSFKQTVSFMEARAVTLFKGSFKVDENNRRVYDLLALYFSNDINFINSAIDYGVDNPTMEKGILLFGGYGTGKTWLMRLFGRNQRQVFHVKNAKDIANDYEKEGQYFIDQYVEKHKNAINDKDSFFHRYAGLCIDDLGTEDVKVNYGNRKNVIGDLIEQRYDRKNIGVFLHATTNLDGNGLKQYYGGRVASRIRESFNIISLFGNDRRV